MVINFLLWIKNSKVWYFLVTCEQREKQTEIYFIKCSITDISVLHIRIDFAVGHDICHCYPEGMKWHIASGRWTINIRIEAIHHIPKYKHFVAKIFGLCEEHKILIDPLFILCSSSPTIASYDSCYSDILCHINILGRKPKRISFVSYVNSQIN